MYFSVKKDEDAYKQSVWLVPGAYITNKSKNHAGGKKGMKTKSSFLHHFSTRYKHNNVIIPKKRREG